MNKLTPIALVAMMMLASTPMVAQTATENFEVPPGVIHYVNQPIVADTVDIQGTLLGTLGSDVIIEANQITVGPAANILAMAGIPGNSHYATRAQGGDGTNGGSIHLLADEVTVDEGALIRAGEGASGGLASGTHSAHAGHGGLGGSIVVEATKYVLQGDLIVGAGGNGGNAYANGQPIEPEDAAIGGNGGNSGFLVVNGQPQTTQSTAAASPVSFDHDLSYKIGTCPELEFSSLTINWDLGVILKHVPGATLPIEDSGSSNWQFGLVAPTSAVCDVVGNVTGLPSGPPDPKSFLRAFTSTTSSKECDKPRGDDGEDELTGRGGDGGDGCSIPERPADGADGGDGANGWTTCGVGGPGGPGGSATASSTVGGNGGYGSSGGGNGGDAISIAEAGDGGDGGKGGKAYFGEDCAGGPGGAGGSATSGSATAGRGGDALCGPAGDGGVADSSAIGGIGGKGGDGNPGGAGGAGGSSVKGSEVHGHGGSRILQQADC